MVLMSICAMWFDVTGEDTIAALPMHQVIRCYFFYILQVVVQSYCLVVDSYQPWVLQALEDPTSQWSGMALSTFIISFIISKTTGSGYHGAFSILASAWFATPYMYHTVRRFDGLECVIQQQAAPSCGCWRQVFCQLQM